jgi:hypothetical protein
VHIRLNISLPIIISTSKFALAIPDVTSSLYNYYVAQKATDLSSVTIVLTYKTNLHNKKLSLSYSASRRLE